MNHHQLQLSYNFSMKTENCSDDEPEMRTKALEKKTLSE